jgi:phospholipid/cholesterol/gamma-HCH transport system permease protein
MLSYLGRVTLSLLHYLGELALLFAETIRALFVAPIRWRLFVRQLVEVGFRSQLVVVVTGAFTGAVFAAQTYFQFSRLGMESAVGAGCRRVDVPRTRAGAHRAHGRRAASAPRSPRRSAR